MKYKLGEICEIVSGSTPKTSVAEYWDGDIKWITPAELTDESYIIEDSVRKLTELGVKKSGLTPFPAGTVILSSRAPIGKVAIAGCEMYCNQGFKNLICSDKINNKYLYWFLKGNTVFLNSLGRGATFKEISKGIVSDIEINVPDAESQNRAVSNLEKLSEIIKLRKNEMSELDNLIKARFIEMFGDPVINPMKWKRMTFREASVQLSDGPFGSNLKSEHYSDTGIRVIRLGNIGVGKFLDSDKSFITEEHYEKIKKYTCRAGEIVIGTLGEPNFRACLIPKYVDIAVNKADCVHYVPKPDLLNNQFVCQYINCPETLQLVARMIHGQTRARVSSGQIANMPIFVPPMELQNQFAAFVEQADKSKLLSLRCHSYCASLHTHVALSRYASVLIHAHLRASSHAHV